MILNELKKIDWQYLVSRREALLFKSITDNSHKYFKRSTGINWRANYILRLGEGDLLYSAKELDKLCLIFSRKVVKLLSNFSNRLVFNIKAYDKIVSKIEKINCSRLSKKQLIGLLKKYFKSALYSHVFLAPMPVADKVISSMILNLLPKTSEQEKQEWLSILTYPAKENIHTKEERSFYKLALAYKNKSKNFINILEIYLKKFAGIGTRGYWLNRVWKKEDILDRLKNFLTQKKNPITELKHLDNIRKERQSASLKLINKLNIKKSSLLYQLILLGKKYAYLRTWRTDILYTAGYKARGLFYEITKRDGLKNKDDIVYLTYLEVMEMAKIGKLPISFKELKKRKEYFADIVIKDKFIVLSGKEWQNKLRSIANKKIKITDEIKGKTAFPGRARGLVKIVLSNEDIKKVKQGEILVAVMTFPHFISAMEKARAFITDEGGILCHAAIISRELKKPCIIGTKIATQILKDGDKVLVDANKGIVKKL